MSLRSRFHFCSLIPHAAVGILAVGLILAAGEAFAALVNVSTTGDDTTGSRATGTPFKTIEAAVAAAQDGDVVQIAAGTYTITNTLSIARPLSLRGIPDANGVKPVLDAVGNRRILYFDHADARAYDLRFYRGQVNQSNGGGGLRITKNGGLVADCEFVDCRSSGEQTGGSITLEGGTLSNCVVTGGYTINGGGNGAGVHVNGSNALVEYCLFYNNSQNGRQGSTTKVGAVYLKAGTVRNCTIVGNNMGKAGGIYVAAGAVFTDSIVWDNVAQNDTTVGAPNWQMASGAYVTNICTPVAMGVNTLGRDLTRYPNFADPANRDYSLVAGTPAAGLGYKPYDPTKPSVGISYTLDETDGITLTYQAAVDVLDTTGATYYWNFTKTSPTAASHQADGASGSRVLATGFYSISLTAVIGGTEYHYTTPDIATVYASALKVVDRNPNAAIPYDTWANAAATVQDAIALAAPNAVITVSNGTYTLASKIDILKPVTIRSLTGNPEDVVLDANHKRICAEVKAAGAVLSGLTLYRGSHDKGGCVSMTANATIENCIIANGKSGGNSGGGGIYLTDGKVSRCKIRDNQTTSGSGDGFGVLMEGDNAVVEHSLITGNNPGGWAQKNGGGVRMSKGTLRSCTIYGNTAGSNGGGVSISGGTMTDCIIWGNTSGGSVNQDWYTSGSPRIYNCWSSVQIGEVVGAEKATFCGDPGFKKASEGDFTLSGSSKCKDMAYGEATVALDLAGNTRVQGAKMDLGCYESDPLQLSVDFACDQAGTSDIVTNIVSLVVTPAGTPTTGFVVYWTFDGTLPTTSHYDAQGLVVTNVFRAGAYDIAMLAVKDGEPFEPIVKEEIVKVYASVVYVDEDCANSAKPWNGWNNAATNLNDVLPFLQSGSVVKIKPGTYPLKAQFKPQVGITFRGYAEDGESAPAVEARPLVRNASSNMRLFYLNHADAKLEHLALVASYGIGNDYGGCVRIDHGTIADCTIRNSLSGGNSPGGGLALMSSDAFASRCIVTNCSTTLSSSGYGGGGIYLVGGSRADNCLVANCKSTKSAVWLDGNSTLVHCTVVTNASYSGNNLGSVAGGISCDSGNVYGCLIRGNLSALEGAAGQVAGAETCYKTNAIPFAYGSGTVTGDPLCVDETAGNWRLTVQSPCRNVSPSGIDAGAKDLDGLRRKFGIRPDLGCYECHDAYGMYIILK